MIFALINIFGITRIGDFCYAPTFNISSKNNQNYLKGQIHCSIIYQGIIIIIFFDNFSSRNCFSNSVDGPKVKLSFFSVNGKSKSSLSEQGIRISEVGGVRFSGKPGDYFDFPRSSDSVNRNWISYTFC